MNFKDQWATDEDGNQFVFTVEMQRRLAEQGLDVVPESLKELLPEEGVKKRSPAPEMSAPKVGKIERQEQPHADDSATFEKSEPDFDMPMTIQIDPETGKYLGRMKWYNAKKGYGFIVRGAGEEIFYHKSSIMGDPENISEGQWVLYDIEDTRKGPEAAEVEPYEGDVSQLS